MLNNDAIVNMLVDEKIALEVGIRSNYKKVLTGKALYPAELLRKYEIQYHFLFSLIAKIDSDFIKQLKLDANGQINHIKNDVKKLLDIEAGQLTWDDYCTESILDQCK